MNKLQKIKTKLVDKGYRLSVAESLSSGNVQSRIGSISGATEFFEGGVTVYSIKQKSKLLNIDKNHARKVNCVSERVAQEMASGVCELFKTQIGISTTGYAEPSKEQNVENPFAYFCIWDNVIHKEISSGKIMLDSGSRFENQQLATDVIINKLYGSLKTAQ